MPKVKQDKAKGPRRSPSHMREIQIPLALVTGPAPASRAIRGKVAKERSSGSVEAVPTPRSSKPAARLVKVGRPTSEWGSTAVAKVKKQVRKPTPAVAAKRAASADGGAKSSPSKRGAKGRVGVATRKPARDARPAKGPARKSRPVRSSGRVSPKGAAKKGGPKSGKHLDQRVPERVVTVKPLDPFARCGPRTSVEHLIRVEERLDGESSIHLVFFDRHGWYCEHGKACRAVDDVRRHGKQLGLTF